jgi:hypothetical protein
VLVDDEVERVTNVVALADDGTELMRLEGDDEDDEDAEDVRLDVVAEDVRLDVVADDVRLDVVAEDVRLDVVAEEFIGGDEEAGVLATG